MNRIFTLSLICVLACSLNGCSGTSIPKTPADCSQALASTPAGTPANTILPSEMKGANIILLLVDDMDDSSLVHMPNLQKLMASQGTSFDNYLVNVSLCCPSRATTLLGMYSHNSGILTNNSPNGGFAVFRKAGHEEDNLATRLQQAGYKTALFGKYLNGYPYRTWKKYIPPGWSEWASPVLGDPYGEYDYSLNHNGVIVNFGGAPEDYLTDVLSGLAANFIRDTEQVDQPFFIYLAPFAPHGPSTPAPRHMNEFQDILYPRTPGLNEADVSDKPAHIQERALLSASDLVKIDEHYRSKLQSLLAVDDMIADLITALQETGKLENTFIFFSSDNGVHMGQHRLLVGKMSPYEEDVRVPLVVTGPGVQKGASTSVLAGNTDLAPTFLQIAGADIPSWMDGRSLVPVLAGAPATLSWREAFLLEHWAKEEKPDEMSLAGNALGWFWETDRSLLEPATAPMLAEDEQETFPQYRGLRLENITYVEYETGEAELYDLRSDPFEVTNLAKTVDKIFVDQLSGWLSCLSGCSGDACRRWEQLPGGMTLP